MNTRRDGVMVVRHPRRADSLGQLDYEAEHGPRVLDVRDVPADLLQRYIHAGRGGFRTGGEGGGVGTLDFGQIARDVNAIASTLRLDRGLLGRVVEVKSSPTLIVTANYPRAYLFLNPAGATGLTTTGTLFSTQTVTGASVVTSAVVGVANYRTARFFVEATFVAGSGPVTFTLQSANPVTGSFIDTQVIFSLTATGSDYANVGELGVDTDLRMSVNVPAGTTITFSVGFVLKDGLEGTSAGAVQTIYLGGPGVTKDSGYPLLNGKEKAFFFEQNTSLYGVTAGPSLELNVFEL